MHDIDLNNDSGNELRYESRNAKRLGLRSRIIVAACVLLFVLCWTSRVTAQSPILSISEATKIQFTSSTYDTYQFQTSTDLQNWSNLGSVFAGDGQTDTYYFDLTGNAGFYRLSATTFSIPQSFLMPFGGTIQNSSSNIVLNGPGNDRFAIFPVSLGTSYTVSGQVNVNGYAGFIIGYNTATQQCASVYNGNGGTEIWTYVGANRTPSTTITTQNWAPGTWIPFSIACSGSLYTIKINNVTASYTLAGSGYGSMFGLIAQFDNTIQVRNLSPNIAPSPLPLPSPSPAGSLVILSGSYGANTTFVNVTSIIQNADTNNSVSLAVNNQTMGGDPDPGYVKEHVIQYTYNGTALSKTISENSTLTLP